MNTNSRMDSPDIKNKAKKRPSTKETADTSNNKIKVDSSADISQFKTQELSSPNVDRKNISSSKEQSDVKKSKSKKDTGSTVNSRKEKSKSKNESQGNISKRTNKKRVKFADPFVDPVNIESFKRFNLGMSYNEAEPEETTRCKCVIF